jgi:hypothetical protein
MQQSTHWHTIGQGLIGSVLIAGLTLWGVVWQQQQQENHAEQVRFRDEAQVTAQETSRLLNDGYNELSKLVDASNDKGWKDISQSSERDYWAFRQNWREQLIAEHFKLARYFGKPMADALIHIDEIDLHPMKEAVSRDVCVRAGEMDIEKLSYAIECAIRFAAVDQDIVTQDLAEKKTGEVMDGIQSHWQNEDRASQLLENYDKETVRYLRGLDEALTQLGDPRVTVVTPKSHT